MPPTRIIPRLDIKAPNVIKGVHLEGLRVVGSPQEMARRYYEQGADEIIFMDVVASLYNRNHLLPVVQEAARDIFIPLTVGGGIRTLDNITAILRSGADKVAINTAATERPEFLREAAEAFGSQCIVLSVEAIRRGPEFWEVMTCSGREKTGRNALDWVVMAEMLGAGEILLTSIDQEGTQAGFDLELVAAVRRRVRVPVIACGGAGNAAHVAALLKDTGADAACCAALFHYGLCSLPDLKADLFRNGIEVRI